MMDVVVAWARTGPSAAATEQLVLTIVGALTGRAGQITCTLRNCAHSPDKRTEQALCPNNARRLGVPHKTRPWQSSEHAPTAAVSPGGHTAPAPTASHPWQETPPVLLSTPGALRVTISVGRLDPAPVMPSKNATPVLCHEVPPLSVPGCPVRVPKSRPGLHTTGPRSRSACDGPLSA